MWFWCKFGATLYQTILTIFTISHENTRYFTLFTILNSVSKTPRDKNIVPLAQFKTHLSRWVFVFISWEQWNESASQILEMTCRSWNSLTRMKCTAVHKDSFYFTICGAYHFKLGYAVISSSQSEHFILLCFPIYFTMNLWYTYLGLLSTR